MELIDIISGIFTSVWGLFTGVSVPGLGVSFAELFLAVLLIRLSIAIIAHLFGFGGAEYRSGSARAPKISDDRKGDDH